MTAKHTRRVITAERRAELLKLRRAGWTYDQIVAERPELGYSSAGMARKDAQRAMQQVVGEPARDLLQLELDRLDELWAAIHGKGLAGDLWAMDRLLRMSAQRARLLGLDTEAMRARLLEDTGLATARGLLGDFAAAAQARHAELPPTDPTDPTHVRNQP